MKISIVVAVGPGRVIGHQGGLPWHIPEDLKHFRKITTGHHIVMGRKTFKSIGKPLPNRTNIILTRDVNFKAPGCFVFNNLSRAINFAVKNKEKELMIIGGEQIYRLALPKVNRIYLTRILTKFAGDSFFPKLNAADWQETSREVHSETQPPIEFRNLERKG